MASKIEWKDGRWWVLERRVGWHREWPGSTTYHFYAKNQPPIGAVECELPAAVGKRLWQTIRP